MLENGVQVEEESGLYTTLYLAIGNTVIAKIYLYDTVKNGAQSVLEQLKKLKVKDFAILSGDKKEIAYDLGEQLGISKVYGELLPSQKLEKLKEIKNQTDGNLIYVGDGINDAPVLAFADVGVSMGGLGSDIAVETSDVVIMDDDIGKIPLSIRHAKKVKNIVLQNVVGSIGIKITIMFLSLIIGVPVWIAMLADVGVMLIALLNSFRSCVIK
jgi:Cd2+/Zn2+-exporting ATPase